MLLTVRFENTYTTGHECSRTAEIEVESTATLEEIEDALFSETGCDCSPWQGEGDSYYEATILAGGHPDTPLPSSISWGG